MLMQEAARARKKCRGNTRSSHCFLRIIESVLLGKDNIPTNRRTCLLEPLNARIAALRNMADVSV